jgi:hypothetical protein
MVSWEQLTINYDKNIDLEDIEEMQLRLNLSVDKKLASLQKQIDNASESDLEDPSRLSCYKEHLEDLMISTYSAKLLGHELSIIALYKKIEIKMIKIVSSKLQDVTKRRLSYFDYFKKVIPFSVEGVQGYQSLNELRLINNCIKHGGYVDNSLATDYPNWIEGQELKDLDATYDRLLPGVKDYVSNMVDNLYSLDCTQP